MSSSLGGFGLSAILFYCIHMEILCFVTKYKIWTSYLWALLCIDEPGYHHPHFSHQQTLLELKFCNAILMYLTPFYPPPPFLGSFFPFSCINAHSHRQSLLHQESRKLLWVILFTGLSAHMRWKQKMEEGVVFKLV